MMRKISLNKSVFSVFWFTFKKNSGFTIIASVLALLVSPIYIYGVITDYIADYKRLVYNYESLFLTFAAIMAIAVTTFLMVLLYINFSFLYKKSTSDFYHALPLKRSELLLARFSGSFASALVPLTVGYIGTFGLTFLDYVSANRAIIVEAYFYTVGMLLLLGIFTLIFILTAGGIFDSIISLLAVNVGFPIIALFVMELCRTHLYGFVYNGDLEINVLSYTTPFGYALVRLCYAIGDYYSADPFFTWYRVVGTVAVIIALAVFVVIIYNHRKSEKVDGSYAFKIIPELIGAIVAVIGAFIFGYIFSGDYEPENAVFWIFGVIGGAIAAVLYSLIINRGFKKVKKALLVSVVSVAVMLIINLGIQFDLTGWEKALPNADEIEKVVIRVQGEDIEVNDIALAVGLNKTIVEEHYHYDDDLRTDNFSFTYTLKNGIEVTRRYDVKIPAAKDLKVELINKELPRNILEEYNEFKARNCSDWNISIYTMLDNSTMGDVGGKITPEAAERIVKAYAKDLEEIGMDYFYSSRDYYDKTYIDLGGKEPMEEETFKEEDGSYSTYTSYYEFSIYVYDVDLMPNVKEAVNSLEYDIIEERNVLGEKIETRYYR